MRRILERDIEQGLLNNPNPTHDEPCFLFRGQVRLHGNYVDILGIRKIEGLWRPNVFELKRGKLEGAVGQGFGYVGSLCTKQGKDWMVDLLRSYSIRPDVVASVQAALDLDSVVLSLVGSEHTPDDFDRASQMVARTEFWDYDYNPHLRVTTLKNRRKTWPE